MGFILNIWGNDLEEVITGVFSLINIIILPVVFVIYVIILFIGIFLKDKSFITNKYSKFNFIIEIIFLLFSIVSFLSFSEIILGNAIGDFKGNYISLFELIFVFIFGIFLPFLPSLYFIFYIKNIIKFNYFENKE